MAPIPPFFEGGEGRCFEVKELGLESSRRDGGPPSPARSDHSEKRTEVNLVPDGAENRLQLPAPWTVVVLVTGMILKRGVIDSHLPWIIAVAALILALELGLLELHLGRSK